MTHFLDDDDPTSSYEPTTSLPVLRLFFLVQGKKTRLENRREVMWENRLGLYLGRPFHLYTKHFGDEVRLSYLVLNLPTQTSTFCCYLSCRSLNFTTTESFPISGTPKYHPRFIVLSTRESCYQNKRYISRTSHPRVDLPPVLSESIQPTPVNNGFGDQLVETPSPSLPPSRLLSYTV